MTPAERAAHMAEVARKREQSDRAKNRELMPETVKHLEQFQAAFGKLPSGRVWENGRTVEWGKRWWDK